MYYISNTSKQLKYAESLNTHTDTKWNLKMYYDVNFHIILISTDTEGLASFV